MKARPILFSGEMVRALLAGQKTQTRRIVKPQPEEYYVAGHGVGRSGYPSEWSKDFWENCRTEYEWRTKAVCKYGRIGDLLWVREAFRYDDFNPSQVIYRADVPCDIVKDTKGIINYKPSIHMPRKCSRLTLKITNIRVERVQYITEQDAIAEGIKELQGGATIEYRLLWEKINGKGSWEQNPWVWCLSFQVIKKNVDERDNCKGDFV